MPDIKIIDAEIFCRYQRELGGWLRDNLECVRPMSPVEILDYSWKNVIAGWRVRLPNSNRYFKVLLDDSFPYSRIKIAYDGDNKYLEWPHIEEENFICLPDEGWLPNENLAYSIQDRLTKAADLIDKCLSKEYVESESKREFLTYWGRQANKAIALSLININNTRSRRITARVYDNGYIFGENDDQILAWLKNSSAQIDGQPVQGIFAMVRSCPSLPLPRTNRQFIKSYLSQAPNLNGLLHGISPFKSTLVILASRTDSGVALFGTRIPACKPDGFRFKPTTKRTIPIWSYCRAYSPLSVHRIDGDWIHGRDQNIEAYATLSKSHVVLLGAGSLGSQVACRIAQAGLGRITIIDPEKLEPSNIGRHALGMDSIRRSKADSLATLLSKKFPIGSFKGHAERWQDTFRKDSSIFKDADLVISCIGEINHELAWDALHHSGQAGNAPTLYGWLGTQGSTGHALALTPGGPALSCLFDPDGYIKSPDTEFTSGDQLRAEPACGTEFQPYGPLAAGQIELLVTRAAIDILMDRETAPFHRVHACSTEDLNELGGRWTTRHKRQRPIGYDGPLQYAENVHRCNNCHNCT